MDAFRSFAHNIHSSSYDEFLTQPIFYNPYILIDKKPFYNSKWYQKDISQITDVFNKNSKILTLKDIQDNFDIELSFVTYYGIVRSIRKYFSSLKIVQPDTFSLLDDTNVMRKLFAITNSCKQYYYILTNNTNIIKAESKWEELFHLISFGQKYILSRLKQPQIQSYAGFSVDCYTELSQLICFTTNQ